MFLVSAVRLAALQFWICSFSHVGSTLAEYFGVCNYKESLKFRSSFLLQRLNAAVFSKCFYFGRVLFSPDRATVS